MSDENYMTMADLVRATGVSRFALDRYVAGDQPKLKGEKCVTPIPFTMVDGRRMFYASAVQIVKDVYARSKVGKGRVPRQQGNVHLRRPTTVMVEMGVEDIEAILEHMPTTSVLYQRARAINDATEWNRW